MAIENFVMKKGGRHKDVVTGEDVNLANEVQTIERNRPWDHWRCMPDLKYQGKSMYRSVMLMFDNTEDMDHFKKISGLPITDRTRFLNIPEKPTFENKKYGYVHDPEVCDIKDVMPREPIYIVSKGRYEKRYTSDALCRQGVPHYIIVESQEVEKYKSRVDPNLVTILELDMSFKDWYFKGETEEYTKGRTGPGPARNFALWHAKNVLNKKWFWTMDDNIRGFYRYHYDRKRYCYSPAMWRAMEDHTKRYDNVLMSGPFYACFLKNKFCQLPFITNTRIYSCTLTRVDMPEVLSDFTMKWYGLDKPYPGFQLLTWNEDSECSLRVLKSGYCTIQYQAFLVDKMATQALKGGNTAEFYKDEGTRKKSEILAKWFPDDAVVKVKFSRIHHSISYLPYKPNQLHLNPKYEEALLKFPEDFRYDYGMKYIDMDSGETVQEHFED